VSRTFAGWTAEHYRHFRRDVPDAVVDQLIDRLGLGPDATAVHVGAGTGQLAVPLDAVVERGGDAVPELLALRLRRSGVSPGP
jgi:ubiquinone/menaquinone biosynthesis C-methylase UbiE